MAKTKIVLHVYDLSRGMARAMSASLVGKHVDGIWHTGIVIYGMEYFYGGGIQRMLPHAVVQNFGLSPVETIEIGETEIEQDVFHQFLEGISHKYTPETYDLFRNNCNNFSDEAAKFLTGGTGIPSHIINLPGEFLETPMGQAISPILDQMQRQMQEKMIPFSSAVSSNTAKAQESSESSSPTKEAAFNLVVKVSAGSLSSTNLSFDNSDPSVEEVKKMIEKETGFCPSDQRIIYAGKILSSGTMSSLGIKSGQALHMSPKPGAVQKDSSDSSASKEAVASAPASSTNNTNESTLGVSECIHRILQAPEKEKKTALKTLLKMIENIVNNPHDEKYRKINRSNPAFTKRMDSVPGSVDVLKAIGFVETTEDKDGVATQFLKLEATADLWNKLVDGKTKVQAALNSLTAASAPQSNTNQTPNPFSLPNVGGPGFGAFGGMNNSNMAQQMQNMMANPEMMQQMMSNPMVQEMLGQMQRDPQMMQNIMEQARNMGLNTPGNPQQMAEMMNNPMFQQMQQQMMSNPDLMRQMMSSMGNMGNMGNMGGLGGLGGMPGFPTHTPSNASTTANSSNSNSSNSSNSNSNNGSNNESAMTEEEMIQEAIRRSLQEQ